MAKVNLDALIPREDFAVNEGNSTSQFGQTLQIRDLEKGSFFYPVLRKPDFQRETADWTPERIASFIESYIDGDLIPAIILWQAGSNIFVIDGGHRLSALIAWVHDDYGDGDISRVFFEQKISDDQKEIAEKTRKLIAKRVGSYKDIQHAAQYPDRSEQDHAERAKKLGFIALQLQWVKGDAEKAEESFFKINQHAAPIDKTELRVLKSRKKPNAIASRAIIRAGTGHKYWSKFSTDIQSGIEKISNEINDLLFMPKLQTPIKTLDLPVAGKGYSAASLPLLLDFVNLVNDVSAESKLEDDPDGERTTQFLKEVRRLLNRITGTHPSSLGLHPVVYFYSAAGRYQPTAFLAVVSFLKWIDKKGKFSELTDIRDQFESFLLKYKSIPNQMANKLGSGAKGGARRLADFYQLVFESFSKGMSEGEIIGLVKANERYSFIQFEEHFIESKQEKFSTNVKSVTFIKDALENPIKCKICGGLIHRNSITVDHIERKRDGGSGIQENAQITHPYCNTTYKN